VHDRIQDSRLVVRNGYGHTSYDASNNCVVDIVDAYLMHGTLPKDGTRC
jgi:hypothetical protein